MAESAFVEDIRQIEAKRYVFAKLVSWNLQLKEDEEMVASRHVRRKGSDKDEVYRTPFRFVSLGEGALIQWSKRTHNQAYPGVSHRRNTAVQFSVSTKKRDLKLEMTVKFAHQGSSNQQRYIASVEQAGNQLEGQGTSISAAFRNLQGFIQGFTLPQPRNTQLYHILQSREVAAVFQLFSDDGFYIDFWLDPIYHRLKVWAEREKNVHGNYSIMVLSQVYDIVGNQWSATERMCVSDQEGKRHVFDVLFATFEHALTKYSASNRFYVEPDELRLRFQQQIREMLQLCSTDVVAGDNDYGVFHESLFGEGMFDEGMLGEGAFPEGMFGEGAFDDEFKADMGMYVDEEVMSGNPNQAQDSQTWAFRQ